MISERLIKTRYVIDTTALISYFQEVFEQPSQISANGLRLIERAFSEGSNILLVIPSIVFIEIFDKWFVSDEFVAKFRAEALLPILNAPNIEIRPLDQETLEMFLKLTDETINLENRDKIILASAAVLEADLITSDRVVKRFVGKYRVIPSCIS